MRRGFNYLSISIPNYIPQQKMSPYWQGNKQVNYNYDFVCELFSFLFETQCYYVAQVGLVSSSKEICLPLPLQCSD